MMTSAYGHTPIHGHSTPSPSNAAFAHDQPAYDTYNYTSTPAVFNPTSSDYVPPTAVYTRNNTYLRPVTSAPWSVQSATDAPPMDLFVSGRDLAPAHMFSGDFLVNNRTNLVNRSFVYDGQGLTSTPLPSFDSTIPGPYVAPTDYHTLSPARVEPPVRVSPTFRCEIPNCGVEVVVDKRQILIHLLTAHNYPRPSRGQSVSCLWPDCKCKKQGADGQQCRGRIVGHASHAEDIVDHIWETHLGFQEVCPKCGDARWGCTFSKGRHEKTCEGRRRVRCRYCLEIFPSRIAFAGHLELKQCPKLPLSVE
jgi:hypothetical protein